MKNKKNYTIGFTLVEIMVVVSIIMIMAALAIPNMIRGRITANEAMAVASSRSLYNACMLYSSKNEVFPDSMAYLTIPESNPPYIEEKLANAIDSAHTKNGYWFEYVVSGDKDAFTVNARPRNDLAGKRRFFFNEDGLIHYSENGSDATVDSPVIN
ncbi:MAG: prepilin-type N-terminal cleavage/methylation domain-containing protein [Candidatus Omnitrophica bacterium]|nr:prepilin-type N-terminal cleavage/methylation domain-containing protein [Candidatus Omnitrophota bacterium]